MLDPGNELRVDVCGVFQFELDMMAIRRYLLAPVDARVLQRRVEYQVQEDPFGSRVNARECAAMRQVQGGLLLFDLERAELADRRNEFRVRRLTRG